MQQNTFINPETTAVRRLQIPHKKSNNKNNNNGHTYPVSLQNDTLTKNCYHICMITFGYHYEIKPIALPSITFKQTLVSRRPFQYVYCEEWLLYKTWEGRYISLDKYFNNILNSLIINKCCKHELCPRFAWSKSGKNVSP